MHDKLPGVLRCFVVLVVCVMRRSSLVMLCIAPCIAAYAFRMPQMYRNLWILDLSCRFSSRLTKSVSVCVCGGHSAVPTVVVTGAASTVKNVVHSGNRRNTD